MNSSPNPDPNSALYNAEYYHHHCGTIPYERSDYWLGFFHGIAEQIVRSLKPRRVLDAGCAKGFLVEALWERGVEAFGIDVSEHAIGEVRQDMRQYCRQASLTAPIEGRFDLVTCFEVLEHIADEEGRAVIRNLAGITDTILFSSTPTDFNEPTHVNVQPTLGWLQRFADVGFAPDVVFDATFVAPHAILLRRSPQRTPDDVLTLLSETVRYRLTIADRQRQLDHLNSLVQKLETAKGTAESELAAVNHQAHLLRVERHEQETVIARLTGQTQNLETAYAKQLQELIESYHQLRVEVKALEDAYHGARQHSEETRLLAAGLAERVGELDRAHMRTQRTVTYLDSRLTNVGGQVEGILHSRIWRALCSGAALMLAPGKLLRRSPAPIAPSITVPAPAAATAVAAPPPSAPARAVEDDFYGFVCDLPRASDEGPRTGKVAISGWALSRSGVDRVEAQLAGVSTTLQMGEPRVDLARGYPDVPGSRTAGFAGQIDTATVPDGRHMLSVRVSSGSGATREAQIPIHINHKTAFASDYDRWIAEFETRNAAVIQLKLRQFTVNPLISIVVPVYRTPLDVLRRAIDSVVAQSYPNWELCIADDCSKSPEIDQLLSEYMAKDKRIRVKLLRENGGISHASNAALALATGEFVALLDHDDELSQDALYHVVEAINSHPDVELLYSDEDKIDEKGRRYDPFFKPDWSPDLLLSENYICHLLVIRRARVNHAGGFRSEFDGSQDYDLVLRSTWDGPRVVHIPRVLYHWRSLPDSTAASTDRKGYAVSAAQRAIQDELDQRKVAAKAVPGRIPGRWRVVYALAEEPRVSIIIPSGGKADPLRENLKSVFAKTSYTNYEVVVIDNSKDEAIQKLVEGWQGPPRPLRYMDWRNRPFNYSVINNEAARHCESPLLLFLNDDTSVIESGWLRAMAELANRPEVGAVGAKLLYPNGNIQHAGVVMGLFENCGHAFKGLPGDRQHYFDLPDVIRNVSAVTGACLMTRADVFQSVGGFDEQTFAVAFNDIDLCLKIGRKGLRVLYTPHALLFHHEAFSKTVKDLIPHPDEVAAMRTKWKDVIDADPFYSPNLTRTAENYSLQLLA
jgi:GT2 family glycosyltransferase/SAM-dependent methyltransferase